MKTTRPLLSVTAVAVLLAATPPAVAQTTVSIDRTSPSTGCAGFPAVTGGHLYSQVVPTGGCDVGGPGPRLDVARPAFGLGPGDEVDALSAPVAWAASSEFIFVFSADRASMGLPGTPYRNQFNRNQAAADLFQTPTVPSISPAVAESWACTQQVTIAPTAPRFLNQTDFNLIHTAGAGAPWMAGRIDDIDAVELSDLDLNDDAIHDATIYFSLDPASPSLVTSAADIYYAPPGGFFSLFAEPYSVGLEVEDDIDALVVWDDWVPGIRNPKGDFAIFSLAPGSPTLNGLDGIAGTADDHSAADLFVTTFAGISCVYTTPDQLGLLFEDNIDGLDVIRW